MCDEYDYSKTIKRILFLLCSLLDMQACENYRSRNN